MNDQELQEALKAISRNRGARWIVEAVLNALLFWQWIRQMFNDPRGGAA